MTRLLVFNRGEIAVRACLAARRLGLSPVLFSTPADAAAPALRYADAVYVCPASEAKASFLSLDEMARAVRATGAEWVYPGYGFLSETEELCRAVEEAGAGFVGPAPEVLRTMAHKELAIAVARRAGIPDLSVTLARGVDGRPLAPARDRFPILLKAAKGGGGRGNVRVDDPASFDDALDALRARSRVLFHDDDVLAERFLAPARHVEIQIFGIEGHGVRALGTRDCSLQRSYQKIVEEGPVAPRVKAAISSVLPGLLRVLGEMGYRGAGTVELLWDPKEERLYFIEVNPRIQVEHTVTEELVTEDLVEWQLREAIGIRRDDLALRPTAESGHAIQARLYAEDPLAGFVPEPGRIAFLSLPSLPLCRWDVGVADDGEVPPYYDPLLAKLIVRGATRADALARMADCVRRAVVHGVRTNLSLLLALVTHRDVVEDRHHTKWVEDAFLSGFVNDERARSEKLVLEQGGLLAKVGPVAARTAGASIAAMPAQQQREASWKRSHRS